MPSLRGITVHVTDEDGKALSEYGVQYIRRHSHGKRVSAYIQSKTDAQFRISVQPRIPFRETRFDEFESGVADGDKTLKHRSHDQNQPSSNEGAINRNLPAKTEADLSSPPEYSLLASLYIDGRSTPERRVIVYLDPSDCDFNRKVLIKHRWVKTKDGTLEEHAWVFKEKAIETVFDKLMISCNQARSEGRDEDAIIEAMQSAQLEDSELFGDEGKQVGQIIVEFRRVVLGKKHYDNDYHTKFHEDQSESVNLDGAKQEITHATGFSATSTGPTMPVKVMNFSDYKPDEGTWATFQFFYRSAEQLQRFGFGRFESARTTAKAKNLNTHLANLTSLSISHRKQSKVKKGKNSITFEEKIQKKAFKENNTPKLQFGSKYRDAPADDELELEEIDKYYPPAPTPFLVPKAPRLSPRRDTSMPALLALDSEEAPVAVASKIVSGATSGGEKLGKARGVANPGNSAYPTPAPVSTTSYSLDLDPRLSSASLNSIETMSTIPMGETFASVTKKASPIHFLKKEEINKLNDFSEDNPRFSSSLPTRDGFEEETDADDELNTESDLETYADDDDFEYVANPEKENEDEHKVESVRAQLKEVRIKKRAFTNVEGQKADTDKDGKRSIRTQVDGGDLDEKNDSKKPATELEEGLERPDKKKKKKKARTED
ncbi:hypothetical protein ACLMJK_003100 [Lecanora helva]